MGGGGGLKPSLRSKSNNFNVFLVALPTSNVLVINYVIISEGDGAMRILIAQGVGPKFGKS